MRGPLTKSVAATCIARLIVLAAEDQQRAILMYIDSPGGLASEALRVLSTINGIRCPVATFCRAKVSGAGAVIAAHGVSGFRVLSPKSVLAFKFDPETHSHASKDSYLKLLAEVVAQDSHQTIEKCLQWFTLGAEFNPREALANGLADLISDQPALPGASASPSPKSSGPDKKNS